MNKSLIILSLVILFSLTFISALTVNIPIATNYSTIVSNLTSNYSTTCGTANCWSTAEGVKCDINDILGSEITNDEGWINQTQTDALYCLLNNCVIWTKGLAIDMPFQAGSPDKDYSGYQNHGTIIGDMFWNRTGGYNGFGAYEFDNVDDYISVADDNSLDLVDNFTYSAWIYPKAAATDYIVIKGSAYYFAIKNTQKLSVDTYTGMGWGFEVESTTSYNLNEWNHVVAVMGDDGDVIFYINGVLAGTGSTGSSSALSNDALIIGGFAGGTSLFNGKIDEVMIWNRALTEKQVLNIYNLRRKEPHFSGDLNITGNVTASYYFGSGAELDDLIITGTINVTGDFSGYALNTSFLYGAGGIGGIDMRADPWWLAGTDLELEQNLIVDGNVTVAGLINGINISNLDGNPFNQVLNKTSNVTFDYVNITGELIVDKSLRWLEHTGIQNLFYINPLDGDGFRMEYWYDFELVNDDWLVFRKTDGNDDRPDGGIAFMMSNSTGWNKTILKLDGYGNANFTDQNISSGNLMPYKTLTNNIGSSTLRWLWLYVSNISAEYISTYNLYAEKLYDSNNLLTIDVDNKILYDLDENFSVDFNDRKLYASDGTTPILDWYNPNNLDVLENATFYKNVIIIGSLYGGSPVKIVGGINVSGVIYGESAVYNNMNLPLLNKSDCDVKSNESGNLYCGIDLMGEISGGGINISTTTCSGNDKVSAIDNVTGIVTCTPDINGSETIVVVGQPIVIRQLADLSTNNNILWSNTDLSFNLAESSKYTMICDILFVGDIATTGMAINLSTTASTSNVNIVYDTWSSATANIGFSATAFETALIGTGSGATITKPSLVIADFDTTSSGIIKLQIRSEVANSNTIIKRGSKCELYNRTAYTPTPVSDATGNYPATVYQNVDINSTSITLWNYTNLNFTLEADKTYNLICDIIYTSAITSTGMAINLSTTASTSNVNIVYDTWSSATVPVGLSATAFETALIGTGSGATITKPSLVIADFDTTSSGIIKLQIRSEVAASLMTLKKGSTCRLYDMT